MNCWLILKNMSFMQSDIYIRANENSNNFNIFLQICNEMSTDKNICYIRLFLKISLSKRLKKNKKMI